MASSSKTASIGAALRHRLLKKTLLNRPHSVPFCSQPRALEKDKGSLPFCTRTLFDSWCKEKQKMYSCDEEKEYRFKIFEENCARIYKRSNANTGGTFGLNSFADMTPDEWLNTYARRYVTKDVIHVDSNGECNEHIDESIKSKKLVVLYFIKLGCWTPIDHIVDSIAKTKTNVTFLKICANKLKALADEYAVKDVPTLVFLRGGNEVDRIVIRDEIPDLLRKMEQHIPIQ